MQLKFYFFSIVVATTTNAFSQTVTDDNSFPSSSSSNPAYLGSSIVTSPLHKLYIGGSIKTFNTGSSGFDSPSLYLSNLTSTTGRTYFINSNPSGAFRIVDSNANASRFVILNNGNVGVGLTNPSELFQVAGTSILSSIKFSTVSNIHQIEASSSVFFIGNPSSTGVLNLYGGSSVTDGGVMVSRNMRIFSDNNRLDGLVLTPTTINTKPVAGTTTLNIGANNIPTAYFDNAGQLGIGTASPGAKLHVAGSFKLVNGAQGAGKVLTSDANGLANWETPGSSSLWTDAGSGDVYYTALTGRVGIGTTSPQAKLAVKGDIYAQKVKVTQTGWADYVFDSSYQLRPLAELADFIRQYKHLPDIPTAKEVEDQGLNLGDNQAALLKKIEELTLYVINQEETIKNLKTRSTQQTDQLLQNEKDIRYLKNEWEKMLKLKEGK